MILCGRQGLDQDYSVAGMPDVGRGDKRDVINSWDSGAADREVYVSSTEHDRNHIQDEGTGFPRFTSPVLWIVITGSCPDCDGSPPRTCVIALPSTNTKPRLRRILLMMFVFMLFVFLSLFWPSVTSRYCRLRRGYGVPRRNHFRPFTRVLSQIRSEVTPKVGVFYKRYRTSEGYISATELKLRFPCGLLLKLCLMSIQSDL